MYTKIHTIYEQEVKNAKTWSYFFFPKLTVDFEKAVVYTIHYIVYYTIL